MASPLIRTLIMKMYKYIAILLVLGRWLHRLDADLANRLPSMSSQVRALAVNNVQPIRHPCVLLCDNRGE
jgi:hypothetical protein